MRILFAAIIALTSVTIAHAESFIPTKDRVKLELWIEGVESQPQVVAESAAPKKELPEEITRILLKYKL
jgi:hypothetical protein